MAELPVEIPARLPSTEIELPGGNVLKGISMLPVARQLGLLIALAVSVALGFSIVLWMKEPDYRSLTGISDPRQVDDVAKVLDANGINYKIDNQVGMLLVPADSYYQAKMRIAGAGISDGTQRGNELLEDGGGFGVSRLMEQARLWRSLEGELAKSIATMNSVQRARVHLAIPKTTTFIRDRRAPSASVTVVLRGGAEFVGEQIRGIKNLVANAVPELSPDNVSVVDQNGRLLSSAREDDLSQEAERQQKTVRRLENDLRDKIHGILLPIVGEHHFSAQVSADMDFTSVEQTEELFNPDLSALRSEQTLSETQRGDALEGGIPGALTNQPPGETTIPEALPGDTTAAVDETMQRSRNQATRNFELDRTISHTRHAVGRVERLTVSVVVDDIANETDEETTFEPWTEDGIERLTALVKTAVGYDASRGDLVTVVNSAFVNERVEIVEPAPFWTENWFLDLVKQGVGAALVILIVLGLLRPVFRNLSQQGAKRADELLAQLQLQAGPNQQQQILTGALPEPGTVGYFPKTSEIDRSVESVRSIVQENPGRVAAVVKDWVNDE